MLSWIKLRLLSRQFCGDEAERDKAKNSFVRIGPGAIKTLTALLLHPDANVRSAAAECLGKIDAEAKDELGGKELREAQGSSDSGETEDWQELAEAIAQQVEEWPLLMWCRHCHRQLNIEKEDAGEVINCECGLFNKVDGKVLTDAIEVRRRLQDKAKKEVAEAQEKKRQQEVEFRERWQPFVDQLNRLPTYDHDLRKGFWDIQGKCPVSSPASFLFTMSDGAKVNRHHETHLLAGEDEHLTLYEWMRKYFLGWKEMDPKKDWKARDEFCQTVKLRSAFTSVRPVELAKFLREHHKAGRVSDLQEWTFDAVWSTQDARRVVTGPITCLRGQFTTSEYLKMPYYRADGTSCEAGHFLATDLNFTEDFLIFKDRQKTLWYYGEWDSCLPKNRNPGVSVDRI